MVNQRLPPALKHAGYSALDVLPGENRAAFEKLREGLIGELGPVGPSEEDVVVTIARLLWRKARAFSGLTESVGFSLSGICDSTFVSIRHGDCDGQTIFSGLA